MQSGRRKGVGHNDRWQKDHEAGKATADRHGPQPVRAHKNETDAPRSTKFFVDGRIDDGSRGSVANGRRGRLVVIMEMPRSSTHNVLGGTGGFGRRRRGTTAATRAMGGGDGQPRPGKGDTQGTCKHPARKQMVATVD
jgi:hypothetical protein